MTHLFIPLLHFLLPFTHLPHCLLTVPATEAQFHAGKHSHLLPQASRTSPISLFEPLIQYPLQGKLPKLLGLGLLHSFCLEMD